MQPLAGPHAQSVRPCNPPDPLPRLYPALTEHLSYAQTVPDGVPGPGGAAEALGDGLVEDRADDPNEGQAQGDLEVRDDEAQLSHHTCLQDAAPPLCLWTRHAGGLAIASGLFCDNACEQQCMVR